MRAGNPGAGGLDTRPRESAGAPGAGKALRLFLYRTFQRGGAGALRQAAFALGVPARSICGLPVCVFPALWAEIGAVAAGKLRRAGIRHICPLCTRMHGARRDGAGWLPRDLAGCGLRDCAEIHGRVYRKIHVGRAADGRAVRVSVPAQPAGGARHCQKRGRRAARLALCALR